MRTLERRPGWLRRMRLAGTLTPAPSGRHHAGDLRVVYGARFSCPADRERGVLHERADLRRDTTLDDRAAAGRRSRHGGLVRGDRVKSALDGCRCRRAAWAGDNSMWCSSPPAVRIPRARHLRPPPKQKPQTARSGHPDRQGERGAEQGRTTSLAPRPMAPEWPIARPGWPYGGVITGTHHALLRSLGPAAAQLSLVATQWLIRRHGLVALLGWQSYPLDTRWVVEVPIMGPGRRRGRAKRPVQANDERMPVRGTDDWPRFGRSFKRTWAPPSPPEKLHECRSVAQVQRPVRLDVVARESLRTR